MPPASVAKPRLTAGHILIPLCGVLTLLPFVAAQWGLLAGVILSLTVENPYLRLTQKATRTLLAAAIVGLGASMNLRVVLAVGAHGIVYTVIGITFCFVVGLLLARALSVSRDAGLLITVGTAICGGSAIAALVPILRPNDNEVSVALGTVFLLNAVALFLFPFIGHTLALDQHQFGLWAALAIHDTSSVVGAAAGYGAAALAIATTVKLARALWIVPLSLAFAWWKKREDASAPTQVAARKPQRPWFILGFLIAAALVTFVPPLQPAGTVVAHFAQRLLVLTLFLIGANLSRSALRAVGVRPLAQGVLLWMAVGGATLWAIATHLIT